MKDRRGFTLIELIAAIFIISILFLIASPSVMKLVKNSEKDFEKQQEINIELGAKNWAVDHLDEVCKQDNSSVDLKTLEDGGYIEGNISKYKDTDLSKVDYNIKIVVTNNDKCTIKSTELIELKRFEGGSVTIEGTATYGETLTAVVTNSDPIPAIYEYQWYYSNENSTDGGTKIEGANSESYTVGSEVTGKYIYVVVTFKKDGYSNKTVKDIISGNLDNTNQ